MQNNINNKKMFSNVDDTKVVSSNLEPGRHAINVASQQPDRRRVRESAPPNQPPYGQVYPYGHPQQSAYPPPGGPRGGQGYPQGGQGYPQGGQGYPPGAYQGPPPPPPNGVLVSNWRQFVSNQPVQVNIWGHGWFVGSVVGMINAVQTFTGSHVRVKYVDMTRQTQEGDFLNDPNVIRPY